MSSQKRVALGMLMDASTSMEALDEAETLASLNGFIKEQTKNSDVMFFGGKFNDTYTLFKNGVNGKEVTITESDIEPDGLTALYDGIYNIIKDVERGIKGKTFDLVTIVILTDGEENSSVKFTQTDVFTLINTKKAEGWNVVFLGANQDSIEIGEALGVDTGSSCDFEFSSEGISNAFTSVSSALTRTINTGEMIYFNEEERESSMCIS